MFVQLEYNVKRRWLYCYCYNDAFTFRV